MSKLVLRMILDNTLCGYDRQVKRDDLVLAYAGLVVLKIVPKCRLNCR